MIKVYPNGLKKAHDTDAQAHQNINALGKYANVVVVDAGGNGGNGDYTTLAAALAAITDASDSNRYAVVMMPGIYTISATTEICKEGVDVLALVPGSVVLTSAATLSNGMVTLGRENAMTTESKISDIKFIHTANTSTIVLRCHATYPFNVRFQNCQFRKSIGSGQAAYLDGDPASLLKFDSRCGFYHDEVTATARYAVRVSGLVDANCRMADCDVEVLSSHADAACFYDSLGSSNILLSVFYSRLKASKIVFAGGIGVSFALCLSVLSTASSTSFTNRVATPNNIIDTGF